MALVRPFVQYGQNFSMKSSSDRTERLRQTTLYGTLANNVMSSHNPATGNVKYKGNYKYKKTGGRKVKYPEPSVTETGCLINATNSSALLDLTKGMSYCHHNDKSRDHSINLSENSWQGSFIQIETGITAGVATWLDISNNYWLKFNVISSIDLPSGNNDDTSIEKIVVDPNYDLFYEPCFNQSTNKLSVNYYKYADLDAYKNTRPYLDAVKSRYLEGFMHPVPIKFNKNEQKNSQDVAETDCQTCGTSCFKPSICECEDEKWSCCKQISLEADLNTICYD